MSSHKQKYQEVVTYITPEILGEIAMQAYEKAKDEKQEGDSFMTFTHMVQENLNQLMSENIAVSIFGFDEFQIELANGGSGIKAKTIDYQISKTTN